MNITGNTIGIDYHAETVQVCVLDPKGKQLGNKKCRNDVPEIAEFIKSYGTVNQVAVEACNGSANFADALKSLTSWKVELCHPGYVSRMKQNPDKTDYSDARLVGDLSRVGYLPKVWLAPEWLRELRTLVRYRQQVRRHITATKVRIRMILRNNRTPLPAYNLWRKQGLEWLRNLEGLGEQSSWIVSRRLEELESSSKELRIIEKRLEDFVKGDPVVTRLLSFKGIGLITAAVMRAEIGVFERFRNGKQLSNFCGVTPRNASSGEKVADTGLIRSGNPVLKTFIIEGAHRLIRYDSRWKSFAKKLLCKGKHKGVVIAAVANRWMRWLHAQMTKELVATA